MRWGVTGAVWATTGAAITGLFAVGGPAAIAAWKGIAIAAAAAVGAGERAGNAMFKRELARMAAGQVQLADLGKRRECVLVVVRGRIACETPLSGLLVDARGVYRRLIFEARGTWVHEAAVDFSLVDDAGKIVLVQAAGARWLTPERECVSYPGRRFTGEPIPRAVAERAEGYATIEAYEQVLAVGTEVQVVGYKTASADVDGEVVDYRMPPQRATLRSGDDLPLVISAIDAG